MKPNAPHQHMGWTTQFVYCRGTTHRIETASATYNFSPTLLYLHLTSGSRPPLPRGGWKTRGCLGRFPSQGEVGSEDSERGILLSLPTVHASGLAEATDTSRQRTDGVTKACSSADSPTDPRAMHAIAIAVSKACLGISNSG